MKKATIVCGLGFGDEGKGKVVDFLTEQASQLPLVVRFSGGAQAAHNVITSEGLHHTFSQFGSGTLRGARTLLSRFVLVDPLKLLREAAALEAKLHQSVLPLLYIDPRAPLVTSIHAELNQRRERARGSARHGSTGQGMGETERYRLHAPADYPAMGDLTAPDVLHGKLKRLEEWARAQTPHLQATAESVFTELNESDARYLNVLSEQGVRNVLQRAPELIFEGSQGALLDEWNGFHPHTTWSTVTPANAFKLLEEHGLTPEVEVVGVLRTYHTRHGAGPFPTEDDAVDIPEVHNGTGEFQGGWRRGYFDLPLFSYAAKLVRPTQLALTHLDYEQDRVARAYEPALELKTFEELGSDRVLQELQTLKLKTATPLYEPIAGNDELIALLEAEAGVPVTITASGPLSSDNSYRKELS